MAISYCEGGALISDEGLSGVLLKVLPGKERKVVADFLHLDQNRAAYLGLGKYDLLFLTEGAQFEPVKEYFKHSDVVDWDSLHVFKYASPYEELPRLENKNVLAICYIKFDYRKLSSDGVCKELKLASEIYSSLPNQESRHIIVCGGIGFYDVLIFIETDDFSILNNTLGEICKISESFDTVKDFVTIPFVKYSHFKANDLPLQNEERLTAIFPENVGVNFLIDCIPGPETEVCDIIRRTFGITPRSILGEHDFTIRIDKVPVGAFLSRVLRFRERAKDFIVSTMTIFEWDFHERPFVKPSERPVVEPHFSNLVSNLENLVQNAQTVFVGDLASELLRIVALIKRTQMNLTTNCLYRDICRLLFRISDSISRLHFERSNIYDRYLNINETLTQLSFSLSQRYSGVEGPYLFRLRSTDFEEYGGINRLILASEALPSALLENFGFKWKGFCLFGYGPEPRRFEFGILNMPRRLLMHPEEWHGIYHESGHEVFDLLFKGLPEKERTELEKAMIRKDLDFTQQFMYLWEVFSDSFGFIYGFLGNWDLYVRALWGYFLQRQSKEKEIFDMDHLQRTCAVFFVFGPKQYDMTSVDPEVVVDDFLSSFREILDMDDHLKIDWDLIAKKLVSGLRLSERGIRTVARIIKDRLSQMSISKGSNDLIELLARGMVPINADPVQVNSQLLAIRQDRECTFKERMTCVMALLDWSIRKGPW